MSGTNPQRTTGEASEDESEREKTTLTPGQLVQQIVDDEDAVINWHDQVQKRPPRIDAFLETRNAPKNRFLNILLYDETRVRIRNKRGNDYYHASHVDTYSCPNGFILAQAPFDSDTETDFWRMTAQQKPTLIVVLATLNGKDGRRVINQFWPNVKQERLFGVIKVRCTSVDESRDHNMYEVAVLGADKRVRRLQLLHFLKWVDDEEVPDNLLDLRANMKLAMMRAEKAKDKRDGPVMLVCPSGVHRCGTFAALDIVLDRITSTKRVGLEKSVEILREQRYGCLTDFNHYWHIADLIAKHIITSGLVDKEDIGTRKR